MSWQEYDSKVDGFPALFVNGNVGIRPIVCGYMKEQVCFLERSNAYYIVNSNNMYFMKRRWIPSYFVGITCGSCLYCFYHY
jgi:hypothetical protein